VVRNFNLGRRWRSHEFRTRRLTARAVFAVAAAITVTAVSPFSALMAVPPLTPFTAPRVLGTIRALSALTGFCCFAVVIARAGLIALGALRAIGPLRTIAAFTTVAVAATAETPAAPTAAATFLAFTSAAVFALCALAAGGFCVRAAFRSIQSFSIALMGGSLVIIVTQ
jgi:hypothetical protein